MGRVITPSGSVEEIESVTGTVDVGSLISDLVDDDHTDSYRISIITTLGEMRSNGATAVNQLKVIKDGLSYSKILRDAAETALKKLECYHTKNTNNYTGVTTFREKQPRNYSHYSVNSEIKYKKLDLNTVEFKEVVAKRLEDTTSFSCQCNFCQKVSSNSQMNSIYKNIIGKDKFFCLNCIRNDYYKPEITKDIMILSFRAVFGYFYYCFYLTSTKNSVHYTTGTMSLYEFREMAELHQLIGQSNPLFKWDQDSFSWFIDFSKVGEGKIHVDEVLKTLVQLMLSFKFEENAPSISLNKFYNKLKEGVLEFAENRNITGNNGRVFSPNLANCGIPEKNSTNVKSVPETFLNGFYYSLITEKKR
jgi:hypothetical protein